jgi:hypothetical protein
MDRPLIHEPSLSYDSLLMPFRFAFFGEPFESFHSNAWASMTERRSPAADNQQRGSGSEALGAAAHLTVASSFSIRSIADSGMIVPGG